MMKNTVATFQAAKGREKLTMLTCYDYSLAKIMDERGINSLLVGDSLGMVELGYPDTTSVTMEEMIHHCAAVARGNENALLVCDMPWLSSQCGVEEAVKNAGRLVKEGRAHAVKMEGGSEFAPEVAAMTRASIPVMAHIGLMPQSVNALGGYKAQGRDLASARKLLADARAVVAAGAFAVLLECVPSPLAARVTREIPVPVIGIGSGPDCDGQVLVWQDMLGVTSGHKAKFVRQFAMIGASMRRAFDEYAQAVKGGFFPNESECYRMEEGVLEALDADKNQDGDDVSREGGAN